MTKNKAQGVLSKDEVDIQRLIERWAKAVRDGNRTGIRKDHVPDILMFDVPPPTLVSGTGLLYGDLGKIFIVVGKTGGV
jgi:ketosteroid isomerase-like protein